MTEFADDFKRKILALAIRSDLVARAPGAFQARLFATPGVPVVRDKYSGELKKSEQHPPMFTLAEIVEKFIKQHRGQRPGNVTMDQLVSEQAKRPHARKGLEDEWKRVRELEVEDPDYVIKRVARWAQEEALGAAVIHASKLLEQRHEGQAVDCEAIGKSVAAAVKVGVEEGEGGWWIGDNNDISHWELDRLGKRVPTGWHHLDKVLYGGVKMGTSFYILAPPKGCKTTALVNLMNNASRARHGVACFTYEMNIDEMRQRLDRNQLRTVREKLFGKPSQAAAMRDGLRAGGAGDIWIQRFQSRKHGCLEAQRVVERLRADGADIDLVVLDYLNIMSTDDRELSKEKRHELAAISREMSQLAKELDVAVWSAALVKRASMNKTRISKDDIAEAFEVISVLDGAVAVCSDQAMRDQEPELRNLVTAAMRDARDEELIGTFAVDLDRMTMLYDEEATQAFRQREQQEREIEELKKQARINRLRRQADDDDGI